jgi:hypothetical protein
MLKCHLRKPKQQAVPFGEDVYVTSPPGEDFRTVISEKGDMKPVFCYEHGMDKIGLDFFYELVYPDMTGPE